ncbi:MAG TPA: biopolymer transporter ExbD [Pyrinomonadaceae bacterium]
MSLSAGKGGSATPDINVTPLIDILLVLLIIFMVITPLKPARFKTLVPQRSEELNVQAKQSPLTLIVNIKKDLSVELIMGGNPLVTDASVNDPGKVGAALAAEFKKRKDGGVWKEGLQSRADLPPDDRIEKTVFIKAPETFKYGDVVKVIDTVKGSGANPVGLQTEALEQ